MIIFKKLSLFSQDYMNKNFSQIGNLFISFKKDIKYN